MSLDFRALYLINQERNAYGLRYNDTSRYRKHCANKVSRLRSTLKMSHGKGRDFKALPEININNVKNGHLQLLLFEAERLFAYAQELYRSDDHHKAIAKHRRSLTWAKKLLNICQKLPPGQLSASSLLETLVYEHTLSGKLSLKRDDFQAALTSLAAAHHLLDVLSVNSLSSRDQALANVFLDEISPEIRYSAHELKRGRSHDVQQIVNELKPKIMTSVEDYDALVTRLKSEHTGATVRPVGAQLKRWTWEGQEVQIRSPEMVDILLKVQKAEERATSIVDKNNKARMARFDALLEAWTETEEIARRASEAQKLNTNASVLSMDGTRDAHFIHSFVMFHLLSQRAARDLLLISALLLPTPSHSRSKLSSSADESDPRVNSALVKLMDTVLQSLNQIRVLSIVDENPDLATHLDACIGYTKARRTLYLAHMYAAQSLKQYPQALALSQRGRLYLREARTSLSIVISNKLPSTIFAPTDSDISALESQYDSDEMVFKSEWYSHNSGVVMTSNATSQQRSKPLFFDIALNYVDLNMDSLRRRAGLEALPASSIAPPSVQAKEVVEEASPPEEPAKSTSRLGGLLGGWWGR